MIRILPKVMKITPASVEERRNLRQAVKQRIENRNSLDRVDVLDIATKYPYRSIDYHNNLNVPEDIPLGNMSFCTLEDGNKLVSVRQFNYRLHPGNAGLTFFRNFMSDRRNHFIITDKDFNFLRKIECDYDISMLEDIRVIRNGDLIQVSATDITDGSGRHKMRCIIFKLEDGKLKTINNILFPVVKEKNYVPVLDGPGVFIADMLKGEVNLVGIDNPYGKVKQKCRGIIPYRGSSQLMPCSSGYVSVVHRRDHHRFYNAFAFFDKSLLQCRISNEFVIFRDISPVNFLCGLEIEGDEAVILPCIHDRDNFLFRIPLGDFSKTAVYR